MVCAMPKLRASALASALAALLAPQALSQGAVAVTKATSNAAEKEAAEKKDPLAALKARCIGPAGMSGRVAAIEILPSDPDTIWVGAASGGLWRSTSGGVSWKPLFDEQDVASIGAIAVHPKRPQRVWVGSGEGNPRNSAASGKGLYLSDDGGESGKKIGLANSERIHRIVLDPNDADVAWIGVLGKAWGPGDERGVYRTKDGGKSFERVLFVDDGTGCADLVAHPDDPRTLFAAMWSFRRRPYDFVSGGKGAGIWRSHDGGDTWTRLTEKDGMPKGELGRIGLAIARSSPQIVYALVEAKKSVLLRSDDGGRSYKAVNKSKGVSPRPFYYGDIRVDPKDPERVYRLASVVDVSTDGGKSFRNLVPWSLVHPDHHALWIHPEDPSFMVDGNDGGVAISRDHGKTWRFVRNLPLAQHYHLAVDREQPYHVYGGMQDNGSWRGPSAVRENGGIRNHHWQELFFGDGFATIPDPKDSRIGYAMSQGGWLERWNRITGERKTIRPSLVGAPGIPEGTKLRFNWNAAIAIDPFREGMIYYGSQFVHRSSDRGDSWTVLSGDLTSNTKAWQKQKDSGGLTYDVTNAENYCSLMTIAPSPVKQGVLWTGSDDGRVHVSVDDGQTWSRVDEAMPGLPPFAWCAHIEASKFDEKTAWAVFDDHRRSDTRAWLFVTHDYGKSWKRLLSDAFDGPCLTLEQDPVNKDLLFLGTEYGLHFSIDAGASWTKMRGGFPTVAVRALIVHPDMHDLVIGTHGRATWVFDDIRALRELSALRAANAKGAAGEEAAKDFHLVAPRVVTQHRVAQTGASRFPASGEFRGQNRPYGAILDLWVGDALWKKVEADKKARAKDKDRVAAPFELGADEAEIVIRAVDEMPGLARTMRSKLKGGLNRVIWNLRSDPARLARTQAPGSGRGGPEVLPGRYAVEVSFGGQKVAGNVDVLPDPRFPVEDAARRANWSALQRAQRLAADLADALERIGTVDKDTGAIEARLKDLRQRSAHARRSGRDARPDSEYAAALEAVKATRKAKKKTAAALQNDDDKQGIVDRATLASRVRSLSGGLQSSWDAPRPDFEQLYARARGELEMALATWNAFEAAELAKFRETVAALLDWLPARKPLEIR